MHAPKIRRFSLSLWNQQEKNVVPVQPMDVQLDERVARLHSTENRRELLCHLRFLGSEMKTCSLDRKRALFRKYASLLFRSR